MISIALCAMILALTGSVIYLDRKLRRVDRACTGDFPELQKQIDELKERLNTEIIERCNHVVTAEEGLRKDVEILFDWGSDLVKKLTKRENRLDELEEWRKIHAESLIDLRRDVNDLRGRMKLQEEKLTKLKHHIIGTDAELGRHADFLASVAHITAMMWYWLHKAPFQSPSMGGEDESLWVRYCESLGLKLPQDERKLMYGDLHRHIADYLRDRGIAPKVGEYKNGVRQEPFPGVEDSDA